MPAALKSPTSRAQAKGQINRLKALKQRLERFSFVCGVLGGRSLTRLAKSTVLGQRRSRHRSLTPPTPDSQENRSRLLNYACSKRTGTVASLHPVSTTRPPAHLTPMLPQFILTGASFEAPYEDDDDLTSEIAEEDFDLEDDLADDDFDNDGDAYPAAPTRIPPPFEDNPDDDPADADPDHEYDDDGTGPSFNF